MPELPRTRRSHHPAVVRPGRELPCHCAPAVASGRGHPNVGWLHGTTGPSQDVERQRQGRLGSDPDPRRSPNAGRARAAWPKRNAPAPPVLERFFSAMLPWLDQHRSEEHTSELQSRGHIVCRLLLEKKKISTT